jgi:hypothetical protein
LLQTAGFGRLARGNRNGHQLIGFFEDLGQSLRLQQAGFSQQLQPVNGFIRLLDHDGKLGGELWV